MGEAPWGAGDEPNDAPFGAGEGLADAGDQPANPLIPPPAPRGELVDVRAHLEHIVCPSAKCR